MHTEEIMYAPKMHRSVMYNRMKLSDGTVEKS